MAPFELTTDALDSQGIFDPRYTCDMDNSSPEFRWANPPPEAVTFALLAEDYSLSNATREPQSLWVIYNIPASLSHLPTGIPPQESLPNGIRQGINSLTKLGYTGPCPSLRGGMHPYVFRLFALSQKLEIHPRPDRKILFMAMEGKILAVAERFGKYQRLAQKAG